MEKVTRAAFHNFWRARSQRAKGGRRESGLESKWRRAIVVSNWEEIASKPTGRAPRKSMGEGCLLSEGRMVEAVVWTGAGGEETRWRAWEAELRASVRGLELGMGLGLGLGSDCGLELGLGRELGLGMGLALELGLELELKLELKLKLE